MDRKVLKLGLVLIALSVFMLTGNARGELTEATDVHSLHSDQATILNEKSLFFVTHEASRLLEPSVYPLAVNRLLGADRSIVVSRLSTKSHLILVNPHRKLFNDVGQSSTGEFLATTLQIPALGGGGAMVSGSTIHVSEHGYVALMTPGVNSEGVIIAGVTAARSDSEQKVELDLMSDGLIYYAVNQNTLSEVAGLNEKILAKASLMGEQRESGGQVLLNARSAAQIQTAVVNAGGIRPARRLVVQGASVRLEGDVPYMADTGRAESRLLSQRRLDPELSHSPGTIKSDKAAPVLGDSSPKNQFRGQSAGLSYALAAPSKSTSATAVPKKARRPTAANNRRHGQSSKHILEPPLSSFQNDGAQSGLYLPWKQPEWMKYLDRFSSDNRIDALNLSSSESPMDH